MRSCHSQGVGKIRKDLIYWTKFSSSALGRELAKLLLDADYHSLAQVGEAAGIHASVLRDWVSGKRVPRPTLFWNTVKRLKLPAATLTGLAAPPVRPCRLCNKPLAGSTSGSLRRRRASPELYVHMVCRKNAREGWRRVPCRDCGHTLWLSAARIRRLKESIVVDGQLYRWCGTCSRRKRSGAVSKGADRRSIPVHLVRYILNDDTLLERYQGQDPYAEFEVRAKLRRHLRSIAPKNWNRATKRPKLAIVKIVAGKVGPNFRPCPICSLVVYWGDRSRPLTAFHPECAEWYRHTRVYRSWRGRTVRGSSEPFPWPEQAREPRRGRPRGPAIDAKTLLIRYQWLLRKIAPRSLGGKSISALATDHQYSSRRKRARSTISEGIAAFIELLPGSWRHVFRSKGQRTTARILTRLFPLPAHRGDRRELVRKLGGKGFAQERIATLLGEPLHDVKRILGNPVVLHQPA